jgi:hypothetical protein
MFRDGAASTGCSVAGEASLRDRVDVLGVRGARALRLREADGEGGRELRDRRLTDGESLDDAPARGVGERTEEQVDEMVPSQASVFQFTGRFNRYATWRR